MRSRLLGGLVVGALGWASAAYAADPVQKGPYLLHLGASSVDVRVELASAAAISVDAVVDGPSDAGVARTFASPSATFHSVHLTGLTPATRYRYTVHAGAGAAVTGTFLTAPDGASRAPFTFVVYGDNRSDGPAHERVVRAVQRESYDFLVNTGDFVIDGGDDSAWQRFFDIEEPILRDHPLFACIGNHELADDRQAAHFARYLGPTEPSGPSAAAPPIYGSFRWGRARFFLLNAFVDWASGAERTWLEDALGQADHEPGVDLRVAVIHHGPHSAGPHGDNERLLAAHIDDLLVAHHVDLVLAGHDHIYERGEAKGLKYIVTGGGGAPLYRETRPIPSTRKVEATYNYVLATVSDDGVAILAKRADGSTLDQCSFARGGSWLCDPKPAARPASSSGGAATAPPSPGPCGCSVPGAPGRSPLAPFALALVALVLVRRRSGAET